METDTITVLTWNIWFDSYKFLERNREILNIVEAADPDIVCLQEVTKDFIVKCLSSWKYLSEYICSDNLDGSSIGHYDVMMLCKKKFRASFERVPFPTSMGRDLLFSRLFEDKLAVGTVHLESLNSHDVREEQMEICRRALGKYPSVILCGDFNFCSYRNYDIRKVPLENDSLARILTGYVDVWPFLNPREKGYTFNSDINCNILQSEVMRYDRILFRQESTRSCVLEPRSIRIIGDHPIVDEASECRDRFSTPPRSKPVFPSDHFGLIASFSISNKPGFVCKPL